MNQPFRDPHYAKDIAVLEKAVEDFVPDLCLGSAAFWLHWPLHLGRRPATQRRR